MRTNSRFYWLFPGLQNPAFWRLPCLSSVAKKRQPIRKKVGRDIFGRCQQRLALCSSYYQITLNAARLVESSSCPAKGKNELYRIYSFFKKVKLRSFIVWSAVGFLRIYLYICIFLISRTFGYVCSSPTHIPYCLVPNGFVFIMIVHYVVCAWHWFLSYVVRSWKGVRRHLEQSSGQWRFGWTVCWRSIYLFVVLHRIRESLAHFRKIVHSLFSRHNLHFFNIIFVDVLMCCFKAGSCSDVKL